MKILDATCGMKAMWYQKNHPFVTFMDNRIGKFEACNESTKLKDRRRRKISPDVVSEWKDVPFPDNHFDIVIFDPPFKIESKNTKEAGVHIPYGRLYKETWKKDIKEGVKELFRVLKPEGVFILKWCEICKPLSDVLQLFPYPPMFGTRTGQKNNTHWICFIKYDINIKLDKYET